MMSDRSFRTQDITDTSIFCIRLQSRQKVPECDMMKSRERRYIGAPQLNEMMRERLLQR
jgi:hypothetical protein